MSNDAAIKAKLKGMRRQLMTSEELEEQVDSRSLRSFSDYLLQHDSYQKAQNTIKVSLDSRENLEYLTELSYFEDFLKLYRFASLDMRKFLKAYIMTFETHVIKRIFRNLARFHTANVSLNDFTNFLADKRHVDIGDLLLATNVEQGVACFQNSSYSDFFESINDHFTADNFNSYVFEFSLDQFVAKKIWQAAKSIFSVSDLREFKKFYGSEFDIININTIYRLKFFYHVDDNFILTSLIPEKFRLNYDNIQPLLTAGDEREFIQIAQQIGYSAIYNDDFDLSTVNQLQEDYLSKLRHRIARQHSTSLFEIINYLDDKYDEGRTIIDKVERLATAKYSSIERSLN